MKTLILILTLLFSANFFSQERNNNDEINRYLQKSHSKRKTANVLLISGSSLLLTGFVVANSGSSSNGILNFSGNQLAGFGISTLGILTALTSIPFYISAGHNKSKSRKISPQIGNFKTPENNYVTAGLNIEF